MLSNSLSVSSVYVLRQHNICYWFLINLPFLTLILISLISQVLHYYCLYTSLYPDYCSLEMEAWKFIVYHLSVVLNMPRALLRVLERSNKYFDVDLNFSIMLEMNIRPFVYFHIVNSISMYAHWSLLVLDLDYILDLENSTLISEICESKVLPEIVILSTFPFSILSIRFKDLVTCKTVTHKVLGTPK